MKPKKPSSPTHLGYASLLLSLLLCGCASSRNKTGLTISTPGKNSFHPASLGTIGVVASNTVPGFSIQRPMTKSEAGEHYTEHLSKGGVALLRAHYVNVLVGLPWMIAGAVTGQTAGAFAGVPSATILQTDSALGKSTHELNLSEALRACAAASLQQQGGRALLVEKPFPPGNRAELTQMSCLMASTLAWLPRGVSRTDYLANQGADTVLELRLIYPGLRGAGRVNPPLAFCTQIEARLNDVSTGRELAVCTMQYRSAAHRFSKWGANDAKLLREELTRFCVLAGDTIGKQLLSRDAAALDQIASRH